MQVTKAKTRSIFSDMGFSREFTKECKISVTIYGIVVENAHLIP